MISSSLVFNLRGETTKSSMFMSAKRIGDVVAIEFLNNAFIHLTVKDSVVYFFDEILFDRAVGLDEPIEIAMRCTGSMHDKVSLGIYAGNRLYESHGVHISLENGVIRRGTGVYPEDALHYFAHNIGVSIPVGCGVGKTWTERGVDCGIISYDHMLLISFRNGLNFPVLRTEWGAKIVKTDVFFTWEKVYDVYVRVWEMNEREVRFRVTFILETGCSIVDNIRLNKQGASQASQTVMMSELTKRVVLGGGSHDIWRKV